MALYPLTINSPSNHVPGGDRSQQLHIFRNHTIPLRASHAPPLYTQLNYHKKTEKQTLNVITARANISDRQLIGYGLSMRYGHHISA